MHVPPVLPLLGSTGSTPTCLRPNGRHFAACDSSLIGNAHLSAEGHSQTSTATTANETQRCEASQQQFACWWVNPLAQPQQGYSLDQETHSNRAVESRTRQSESELLFLARLVSKPGLRVLWCCRDVTAIAGLYLRGSHGSCSQAIAPQNTCTSFVRTCCLHVKLRLEVKLSYKQAAQPVRQDRMRQRGGSVQQRTYRSGRMQQQTARNIHNQTDSKLSASRDNAADSR